MSHKIFRFYFVLILVIGLFTVTTPQPAHAAGPWYVATTGNDNNDCLSSATACATINGALGKASSGDTVYVAEGMYTGSSSEVVLIDKNITLSGGWDSGFSTQSSFSTVDGQYARRGVLVASGVTAGLDRFIVRNGSISNYGGGIYSNGDLIISNSSIHSNSIGNYCYGGGIFFNGTSMSIENSTVSNNRAGCNGGGVFSAQIPSTVNINNSTISNNEGGGLYNNGTFNLNNSIISGNETEDCNGTPYTSLGNNIIGNTAACTIAATNGDQFDVDPLLGSFLADQGYAPLLLGSPAIDTGDDSTCLSVDQRGVARPQGTSCDIGAYERATAQSGPAVGISLGSGNNQRTPLLTAFPVALQVAALDSQGNPVSGVAIDFSAPASGPSGTFAGTGTNTASLNTDADGYAATIFTANDQAGSYTVSASATGLGTVSFNLEQFVAPANDNFANAEPITALPFTATVDNTEASAEPGEPQDCTFPFKSVWYTISPAVTMAIRVDMAGSLVGGAVSIFVASGPAISDLTSVGCAYSGNSGNFQLEAGKVYYLRVDSFGQPGILQVNLQQITPPTNDNFANAESITSLPFTATLDNTDATTEPGEPQGCGFPFRSVWYAFTPAESMAVRVSMAQNNNSGNVSIFLSSGPTFSDLTSLGCAFSGSSSNLQVEAGKTYYLRVDSFGQPGVLQIDLEQITPPANDNFVNAEVIASLPFNVTVDTTDATVEPGEPQNDGCGSLSRTVWYAITPTENTAVQVTMTGSTFGSVVKIYLASGPNLSDLALLSCSFSSSTNLQMEAGKTYYLQVDSSGLVGGLELNLEQIIPPANDNFANAETIASLPFTVTVDNTNATVEPGEGTDCLSQFRSVWYSFSPTENMELRMNTFGSTAPGNVSIYLASGPSVSDLIFLTCTTGGSSARIQLETGKTYYLRVDSYGQAGPIKVNLVQSAPPANDNFVSAEVVASLPFSTTVDVTDATNEPDEPRNCYSTDATVWYAFTPTETMLLRANALGSSVAGNVNIYSSSGAGFAGLQFLNCSGPTGSPSFLAEAGQTYYLQVSSAFGESGTVNVNLKLTIAPANDNLVDAATIPSLPFSGTIDITDATIEPDEPQFCAFMPNTVWYAFTPAETTKFQVDTQTSPIRANVNVYHASGPGFADLQFLQCSGGAPAAFPAEADQTYMIQAGGTGEAGSIQFNLNQVFSISGRVLDAVTGAPLPGDVEPYTTAHLYKVCGDGCLDFVNSQNTDAEGRFVFDSYSYGSPLSAGSYQIIVTALLHETQQFGPFEFGSSNLDVGDLRLIPPSVIHGRVVASDTGLPLPGVSVALRRCDSAGCSEFVNSQNTADDGLFKFNSYYYGVLLPAGIYELEISATLYQTRDIQVTITDGEDRDLGDVFIDPSPLIGSISGRLIDAVTGTPIAPDFTASLILYRCEGDTCSFVNSTIPDAAGLFRFETDYSGNRLIAGSYRLEAFADQYFSAQTGIFEVGENMAQNVGDVRLNSLPVRFSEVQPCADIPASGGECVFTVRVSNGTSKSLAGKVWSLANGSLPDTFAGYTNFQIKDPQDLNLGKGKSKVFSFRFTVPATTSTYGTYVCTRLFVGQGSQALFNTIGVRDLFCVYRNAGGFTIASPGQVMTSTLASESVAATATEIEPNNSCQTAQDVGALVNPFVLNGNLDSSSPPDIDFFRFTGTPGSIITIDHEGSANGQGTLENPLLGVFDSNCNLITFNDDTGSSNSHLEMNVPEDGIFVVAATAYPDFGFSGVGSGSYRLTVTPPQFIGSIGGVLTDSLNGKPLRGDATPFAFVRLLRCDTFGCSDVNSQNTASDGSFHFATDFNGNPLRVGNYMLVAFADQYQYRQTEMFPVGEGEAYDTGQVALDSYPIRLSDTQVCSLPAQGGVCDFSVKITNGLATKFSGKAWSIINGDNIGSFTNYTSFQTAAPLDVSLQSGRSMVLRFRFTVRGSVADGAYICATVFAGQNPDAFFHTVGQKFLFCFVKGSNGFTLMSEQEMQSQLQHMPLLEVAPTPVPALPKKQRP